MSMHLDDALSATDFDTFYTFSPARLISRTRSFSSLFPGKVLYAVKANPLPQVLAAMHTADLGGFDVASIAEAECVAQAAPGTRCWFMNPAKARRDIDRAWREFAITDFVADSEPEIDKLLDVLPHDDASIRVFLRFHSGASDALYDLNSKFGASASEALRLLGRLSRETAWSLALAFHTGSQTASIAPYLEATTTAARMIEEADFAITALDIGGGFPAPYANMPAPPVEALLGPVLEHITAQPSLAGMELLCEPGRAVCYDCMSLFARIILRKDTALYCGTGIFGGLLPAQQYFKLPVRIWRDGAEVPMPAAPAAGEMPGFTIFGPTCDANDRLAFPYELPRDVREGDWIEFLHVGAYSESVRCAFNGFTVDHIITV